MPKVIVSDKKGLNQVAGGGLEVKLGDLTLTRRLLTEEKKLPNGVLVTDLAISIPQFARVVSWKIETISIGAAAGSLSLIGTVGDPNLITESPGLSDLTTLQTGKGFPLATGAPAEGYAEAVAGNRVVRLTHTNALGANGPTVRVSIVIETVA